MTDVNGQYTLSLTRTADISPANTTYEIIEYIPQKDGGHAKHRIQVGASPATLYASRVNSSPPTPDTYLTQSAGDARYVQSPGSFGTSASESRPNDADAAGVAATYSRSDHKHNRETVYGVAATRTGLAGTKLYPGLTFQETETSRRYVYRTAAWHQVVDNVRVANAAARTALAPVYRGLRATEDDTGLTYEYYGATTGWALPWGQPWGRVAYAERTASTAALSAETDIATSSSFTFLANRLCRISIKGRSRQVTGGLQVLEPKITNSSNTLLEKGSWTLDSAGISTANISLDYEFTSTAGAQTFKFRLISTGGTWDVIAAATQRATISIVDLGPLGNMPAA